MQEKMYYLHTEKTQDTYSSTGILNIQCMETNDIQYTVSEAEVKKKD